MPATSLASHSATTATRASLHGISQCVVAEGYARPATAECTVRTEAWLLVLVSSCSETPTTDPRFCNFFSFSIAVFGPFSSTACSAIVPFGFAHGWVIIVFGGTACWPLMEVRLCHLALIHCTTSNIQHASATKPPPPPGWREGYSSKLTTATQLSRWRGT